MSAYDLAPSNELIPKARATALKAVQVDDTLAEAHTSLAVIAQDYDWDWRKAEKEYRRAIELDPNYATAHHWYAVFLAFQGRFDEAFREIGRARELYPLSLIIAADNDVILYYSRQYDRAIERFRAVLDMEPGFARTLVVIEAYVQKGQFQDALAEIERWPRHGDSRWVWAEQAYLYGRSGQPAGARQALHELEQLNRGRRIVPFQMITSNLGLARDQEVGGSNPLAGVTAARAAAAPPRSARYPAGSAALAPARPARRGTSTGRTDMRCRSFARPCRAALPRARR